MPRILVCDDHYGTLEIMSIILNKEGYDVDLRSSIQNIVHDVKTIKPDLLLLDLRMPFNSGGEVTRTLKANKDTSYLPIVIFSADNKGEVIARSAGADAYIAKPFELQYLIKTLNETLSRSLA